MGMTKLLHIWSWKFDNVFTEPNAHSEHGKFKDDITPGMVKSYIQTLLNEKEAQHKRELKQLRLEILEANDISIRDGQIKSAIYDHLTKLFYLHGAL